MESWSNSYVSQDNNKGGYVSNHTHKNSILKPPSTFSIHNQLSDEMGFSQMLGKPTNSKLSNNSNSWDSLIDLNLGRFGGDHVHGKGDAIDVSFSKGTTFLCSSESSTPLKRLRASSRVQSQSQIAYCQVYGCNKDLSSCKDYHKRHKVCEVHSKTPTVIVNDIQQRFCQQCSRFHLLGEFDDDKRSCRKRLAGHNERRRKPQGGIYSGKYGRLLQTCGDSIFNGTKLPPAPFNCPEVFSNGVMHSDKYGTSDFWRPLKAEHGAAFRHLSSVPVPDRLHQSKSLFPSFNEKQFPYLHENSATSTTESLCCESTNHYSHAIAAQNSGLRPLFQNTSLGSDEDFNVFHTESTIQGLSGISDLYALSLLSSQSQDSSSQSSGIPLAPPLVTPSSHYSISHVSETIGISSLTSSSRMSNRFPFELNSADGSHLSHILISDNIDIANFEVADGIFQDSDFMNVKDHLSDEDGATIDLLQLSSQLQRVEHQRKSLQMKKENDSSCTLQIN